MEQKFPFCFDHVGKNLWLQYFYWLTTCKFQIYVCKKGKDKSQKLQQNVYQENIGKILLFFLPKT